MTDLEAEDAQTVHPRSRQPECACAGVGRGECECDDDGSAAHSGWELLEWLDAGFPAWVNHAPDVAPLPAAPADRG